MAKLTLNTIGSRYGSIDALNANFDAIETALENTLSRDGTLPNNMDANLDMDSNRIINLADGIDNSDAVTLRQVNGIVQGASSGIIASLRENFVATAGQTVFNIASFTYNPGSNNLAVYLDGVRQYPGTSYTETDNNTITFSAGLHVGALVMVISNQSVDTANLNAALVHYNPAGTGAVATNVQSKLRESVSVKDFGAVGDGVTDDTAALQNAINYVIANNKVLRIPAGTYLYSSLNAITTSNVSILGDGSGDTVLKFTGTGIALDIGTSAAFRQSINLSGFTVEGNANTTNIIRATAIARSQWTDINVREANSSTGVGFVFRAIQLNRFDSLICSQDLQAMTNVPLEAFNIEALAPYGNSSNNTFTNLYAEGAGVYVGVSSINIGVRITGGDNNVFIAGSPESCKTYGLLVGSGCRYNTFIGFGFENLNSTADVADAGISSRYINCYSSQKFIIQDRSCVVQGGYFERIQIDNTASRARVQDVTINNWATGAGGFVDNGLSSFYSNIYDIDSGAFVYVRKDRVNITVGASPTSWANNTGQFVEVVAQTGTLTQVRMIRGVDSWLVSTTVPNTYLVGPNDEIEFTYSVAPALSYVPYNGFQG